MSWPLPALLAWAACWIAWVALRGVAPLPLAFVLAAVLGLASAWCVDGRWRRLFVAAGFPLSLAASGLGGSMPAWTWLILLGLLLAAYPLRAWRDAPLFPTPAGALLQLARHAPLQKQARVLDGGCGLGAGLRELHHQYPHAQLEGVEWSVPLSIACALRCRFAAVRRGDLWMRDWSPYALVYLFQRPESMQRAAVKASQELRPGAWLASLEFPVPSLKPRHVLDCPDGRRLWLYCAPFGAG
jgi:hypothetical protein